MNIVRSFSDLLEANSFGELGIDLFIGGVPLNAPSACWWLISSGGANTIRNKTGEVQKKYIIDVFYRNSDEEQVYEQMQLLEVLLNSSNCTQLSGFEIIEIEASTFPVDQDLDSEERSVGMAKVTITTYSDDLLDPIIVDLDEYTRAELQDLLDLKSNVGHNHDDRYYTESEVDVLIGGIVTTETDPVFSASPSAGITNGDISDWNNALQSETDPLSLHLDQTTRQTIENGAPIFASGLFTGDVTVNRDGNGVITGIVYGDVTITLTYTSGYVSSYTDGINTWTINRNANNQVTGVILS